MKILIINGPNLNLLGRRQPEIYGTETFANHLELMKSEFPEVEIEYFQSNSEGAIIDALHTASFISPDLATNDIGIVDGIILNAGAYTHYSFAIADAIEASDVPVVEVHISNTARREEFRHTSVIGSVCVGTIAGFGLKSYNYAMLALIDRLGNSEK